MIQPPVLPSPLEAFLLGGKRLCKVLHESLRELLAMLRRCIRQAMHNACLFASFPAHWA